MTPAPEHNSSKPTLDDLLRFKRAEHPEVGFWDRFERGLREKQLAALMQQPRGWARARLLLGRGLRWSIPVAAVAMVILQMPFAEAPNATAGVKRTPSIVASSEQSAPSATVFSVVQVPALANEPAGYRTVSVSAQAATAASAIPSTLEPPRPAEATTSPSFESVNAAIIVPRAYRSMVGQGSEAAENFSIGGADGSSGLWAGERPDSGPVGSWRGAEPRLLQLTALDLRVTASYAENLPSSLASRPLPSPQRWSRTSEERDFRDVASRVGVKGSMLSIKF